MGDKWKEMSFDDAVKINPSRIISRGAIAPHISMDTLQPFTREISGFEMKDFKGSGSRFQNGDTLLARITPCLENGKTAFVSCLPDDAVGHGSTEFIVLSGKEGISDNLFVYYLSREPDFRNYAIQQMEGSTGRQRVPAKALSKLAINFPPLPQQKAIASILGALDDKIEMSRKMNETLEAMAKAIFKSWFVDFDPIPGIGHHREWQDSPLGKIPKGWRVGTLSEICENHRRGVKPEDAKPGTPYIGLEHMPRKNIALSEWGLANDVVSNKFFFKESEILFGKLRPYFHKVGVAAIDGVCSTDILVINSKALEWYGLALSHLSSDDFVNYADGTSSGTKMPRTNWSDMARYQIVIPPETIARKFTDSILPMVETIQFNIHQSRTLASIRDALLPKLLSGEIRVRDAERFVEKTMQ